MVLSDCGRRSDSSNDMVLTMLVTQCDLFVDTEPTIPQTLASMEYLQIMQPNGIPTTFASIYTSI